MPVVVIKYEKNDAYETVGIEEIGKYKTTKEAELAIKKQIKDNGYILKLGYKVYKSVGDYETTYHITKHDKNFIDYNIEDE